MNYAWELYAQNGFLEIDDLLTHEQCDVLNKRAKEIVHEVEVPDVLSNVFDTEKSKRIQSEYFLNSGDKISLFYGKYAHNEGNLVVEKLKAIDKIGHALHALDPVFAEISQSEKMRELVAGFAMAKPAIAQSMYIFKHPHTCGEVNCHQDGTYLFTSPESTVGIWIALEDATLDNGCLWVAPGEHNSPLRERMIRQDDKTLFKTLDNSPWPTDKLVPIELKKGSALLLHSRLPHASMINKSTRSRPAYTLHIVDRQTEFSSDNWIRPFWTHLEQRKGAIG